MFHRPKTEEQTATPAVAEPVKQQAAPAAASQKPEQAAPVAEERKPQPAAVKVETQDHKPEEKTMSKDIQDKPTSSPAPAAASSYQPPQMNTATPPRAPGSSSYAYPGAAAPGNNLYGSAPGSNAASSSSRRLVIGQGITMSGEIESCDYLMVEGTVEAALKGASTLEIAETGTFYGTVEIMDATIAGCFEGDITASGRITITSTGSVTGSLFYKELTLEAGAIVDGKVSPINGKAAKKADKPKKSGHRNDNDGSEQLPFSTAAV